MFEMLNELPLTKIYKHNSDFCSNAMETYNTTKLASETLSCNIIEATTTRNIRLIHEHCIFRTLMKAKFQSKHVLQK